MVVVKGLALDNSIESVVIISSILNSALVPVWVNNAIRSMDSISIARFSLVFDITGVNIMNAIREVVFGMRMVVNFVVMYRFNVMVNWFHMVIGWLNMVVSWLSMMNVSWSSMVSIMVRINVSCGGNSYQSQESYTLEKVINFNRFKKSF